MSGGWRKGFFEKVVGKWKLLVSYGPDLQCWAQWDQGDGGAFAFAWLTVAWRKCVCDEDSQDWAYCSFHHMPIGAFYERRFC